MAVISLARLGIGGSLWMVLGSCRGDGDPQDPRVLELWGLFSDRADVKTVGREVLRARRDWRSADLLVAELFGDPQWGRAEPTEQVLLDRIRADLKDGRIVLVDRWVLAETEARLYALAAMA